MKPLPSVLNSILQKRYFTEAVTTSPDVSYTKKKEEEEPLSSIRFAPTLPSLQPELKMPAASEFPSAKITEPATTSKISEMIKRALEAYPTSPEYFGDPDDPISQKRRLALEKPLETTREMAFRRERRGPSSKIQMPISLGIPPISKEQLSSAAQTTKSGVEKAVSAAGKYAKEQMPVALQTARSVPATAAHLGLGIVPFEFGSYLGKQITPGLPTDPIFGENPVSVMAGTAAAAATTPWLVDAPIAISKGLGLRGLQNLSLTGAEGWAAGKMATQAGLRTVPYVGALWTAGQAMYELDKLAQPYREKRAAEIERIQSFERAQRRRENREPSFAERMDDYFLELSKYGGGVY